MADIQVLTKEGGKRGSKVAIEHRSKRLQGRAQIVCDQLLPGIPDEITIHLIAPKLPWAVCRMLWSVSRVWQEAIQSRQIYKSRVRSQATQAFVVMNHDFRHIDVGGRDYRAIAVYSVSDGSSYNLPNIPGLHDHPWSYQCVVLDGKVYILGGSNDSYSVVDQMSVEVHVLDLAGRRQWKKRASMRDRRGDFGCGVMNGKIYVFGGVSSFEMEPVWGSEVYDPESDAWSPIAPIKTFIGNPNTTAVGEEFFVHDRRGNQWSGPMASVEIYHPQKDEWRSILRPQFASPCPEVPLVIGGKLHHLTRRSISVYDISRNSWETLRSFAIGVFNSSKVDLLAAVIVNDEILATVRHTVLRIEDKPATYESCLVRSNGLNFEENNIVWKRTQCSLSFKHICGIPFMYVLQL